MRTKQITCVSSMKIQQKQLTCEFVEIIVSVAIQGEKKVSVCFDSSILPVIKCQYFYLLEEIRKKISVDELKR